MNKIAKAYIISNYSLKKDIFLISVELPFEIQAKPGQFCILKINQRFDPLLGRPFSIFDIEGSTVKFLYRVKGRGTTILSKLKEGDVVTVTGPFGRWYPYPEDEFVVVAGGIGIASVYYLIKKFPKKAYLFYGVRSEEEILFYDELNSLAKKLFLSTESGSMGYKGVVTDLYKKEALNLNLPIYACGPMVMLKSLKHILEGTSIPCYVAVEERMACGVGACLGCVINTNQGLKRVCTDGPVFEIKEVVL